jgi:phage terminase Nu1 subunit (DNA packaging protein)
MKPNDCSLTELATVLGISSNSAAKHSEQFRLAHGRYNLAKAVQHYVQTKKAEAEHFVGGRGALAAAKTRQALASAALAEINLKEKRGELVNATAALNIFTAAIANVKARLLALPSRCAPRLALKSAAEAHAVLKKEVHGLLTAVAHFAANSGNEIRAGNQPELNEPEHHATT